tara:strand:+ start:5701 stop:6321 length:621 start_codon:yes stop_codon:yes gene_type:complete
MYYLAIAVFGYLGYKTCEKDVNIIIIKGFYNITKLYHVLNQYFITYTLEDNEPEEKKIEKTLLEIINSDQNIIDIEIPKEIFLEKIKKNILILKVNDNYKILKDTDYENINKIDEIKKPKDKLFLQITYNDINNEVEIHNKMLFFVMEGNEILSKKFLLWFMKQYYNIDIRDDYRVQIIDNDINIFDIKDLSSIKIKKNTYSLESE